MLVQIAAAALVAQCSALSSVPLDHARIEVSEMVDKNVCKVTGIASPVTGSRIRFEVWLPPGRRWSGRYYQIGNGGFAGAIHEPTLAEGAARGDAIAGTDTGHTGNGFDASWAPGHQIQIDDYGWRSIKATSDAARALLRVYYGRPARRHYAIGCSNGWRMALMAAARWPTEWDGIIAGAPANPWTDQLRSFAQLQGRLRTAERTGSTPSSCLRSAQRHSPKCPKMVRDGVALEPLLCGTDFANLRCSGTLKLQCLSDAQVESLSAIVRAGDRCRQP